MINEKCIVRCDRSGVFFGTVVETSADGKLVKMSNARKLYHWEGALAAEDIATVGVRGKQKFTNVCNSVTVTDAIQIIPCSKDSIESIEKIEPWKAYA